MALAVARNLALALLFGRLALERIAKGVALPGQVFVFVVVGGGLGLGLGAASKRNRRSRKSLSSCARPSRMYLSSLELLARCRQTGKIPPTDDKVALVTRPCVCSLLRLLLCVLLRVLLLLLDPDSSLHSDS